MLKPSLSFSLTESSKNIIDNRQAGRQAGRKAGRKAGRQVGRQAGRKEGRKACDGILLYSSSYLVLVFRTQRIDRGELQ